VDAESPRVRAISPELRSTGATGSACGSGAAGSGKTSISKMERRLGSHTTLKKRLTNRSTSGGRRGNWLWASCFGVQGASCVDIPLLSFWGTTTPEWKSFQMCRSILSCYDYTPCRVSSHLSTDEDQPPGGYKDVQVVALPVLKMCFECRFIRGTWLLRRSRRLSKTISHNNAIYVKPFLVASLTSLYRS
jgi:hypothetical protein